MSYCRFSHSDVYMFNDVRGGICCQVCQFADKVKTIWTHGWDDHPLFGDIDPCENCEGEGCDQCKMHGSTFLDTREEAIRHLKKHREAGDDVPQKAIDRLKREIEDPDVSPVE